MTDAKKREEKSMPQGALPKTLAELAAMNAPSAIEKLDKLANAQPSSPQWPSALETLRHLSDPLRDTTFEKIYRAYASQAQLNQEIDQLRQQIKSATVELHDARQKGAEFRDKNEELESLIGQLKVKEDLGFLLTRVSREAQDKLIADDSFRSMFAEDKECRAFVMSVDIRRSTELMLKARSPSLFAEFISKVTKELYSCVVNNGGVFDKFTGDGILAFFPEEFSGDDFGYRVVKTAQECHQAFQKIYRESRGSFTAILKDIGLGIGVDFGTVRLLRVAEGLTVVGVPVVYACRLSGAEPGQTLLNQPAYEMISEKYGKQLVLKESALSIKHEGEVLAYDVTLGHERMEPAAPAWHSS